MFETISQVVLIVLSLLVIIIFVGSIYAFFYAIFQFIFSAGDPEKIKKARNSIRFMILGIILTVAFLFIFPIIFKRMQVPGYQEYTANNIFKTASQMTRQLFQFGREAFTEWPQGSVLNEGSSYQPTDSEDDTTPPPSQNDQQLEL